MFSTGPKLTKSQKRKQRLLKKGAELANKQQPRSIPIVNVALPAANAATKRSRRRAAKRRAQQGMLGVATSVPSTGNSSYLNSLMFPERANGSKVPDEIGYPTGSFQVVQIGTLPNGTSGDSVGIRVLPIIGSDASGYECYSIKTLKGTSAGSLVTETNVYWQGYAAVKAAYYEFRPVSMQLEVSFIGATSSDQGRITAGCTFINQGVLPVTFDDFARCPDMDIWPSKNGASVVWKPLDNSNLEFTSDFADISSDSGAYWRYPMLVCAVTGINGATVKNDYMYRVVANFEAIPKRDAATIVDLEPSPYNVAALKKAFDWAQQAGNAAKPIVGIVGQALDFGRTAYNAYSSSGGRLTGFRQSVAPSKGELKARAQAYRDSLASGDRVVEDMANLGLNEDENDNNSYVISSKGMTNPVSSSQAPLSRTTSGDFNQSQSPRGTPRVVNVPLTGNR